MPQTRNKSWSLSAEVMDPNMNEARASTTPKNRRQSEQIGEKEFAKQHFALDKLFRADPLYKITSMEKAQLWKYRRNCAKYSRALPKLLLSVNWMKANQVREAHRLLKIWAKPESPTDVLDLLDERFGDPMVRLYAVNQLRVLHDEQLAAFLPQLTQALKYEHHHSSPLSLFLMERAIASPNLIGIRLYWSLRVETDHPLHRERFGLFISEYLNNCGARQRAVVVEQDKLFSQHGEFARIAKKLQRVKGGKERQKQVLREELSILNKRLPDSFQLPLDPQCEVGQMVVSECRVMGSAKKPLWLVFENAEKGGKKILSMFKAGDDLRQDCVTLQILKIMDDIWFKEGLNLHMKPYKCAATWHDGGMLEIVHPASTTAQVQQFVHAHTHGISTPHRLVILFLPPSCLISCITNRSTCNTVASLVHTRTPLSTTSFGITIRRTRSTIKPLTSSLGLAPGTASPLT